MATLLRFLVPPSFSDVRPYPNNQSKIRRRFCPAARRPESESFSAWNVSHNGRRHSSYQAGTPDSGWKTLYIDYSRKVMLWKKQSKKLKICHWMHGPPIKWNFMTDGFYVFLTFILTEPTAWNSLERPPFHGGKKSPTASRSISALELLRSSRSVHLYLRILTTCWKTVAIPFSMWPMSWL